jgi:hypothetical protein
MKRKVMEGSGCGLGEVLCLLEYAEENHENLSPGSPCPPTEIRTEYKGCRYRLHCRHILKTIFFKSGY